jgi:hypothetical protein
MPLIRVETNQQLNPQAAADLCARLSRAVAEGIGKPEQYVQAIVSPAQAVCHGGAPGPAAFVDVRSIGGLGPKVNRKLSERICGLLAEVGVAGERVYLNFTDVSAMAWGHDGSTFG